MASGGEAATKSSLILPDRIIPNKDGWIDVPICEAILTKDVRILCALDGSDDSMTALRYVSEGIMQADRRSIAEVVHVYDESRKHLPVSCQKDALKSTCDAIMTGSVSSKRCKLNWVARQGDTGGQICDAIRRFSADYTCMGFYGLKARKEDTVDLMGAKLCSHVSYVLSLGNSCSLVCIKDVDAKLLPLHGKKGVFVVSVSLNKSSTKAFLDALRLSKPGDDIYVVYVKSFMESEDSDYTQRVREKYEGFFESLADKKQEVFSKFHDRNVKFVVVDKHRREGTSQSVVRFADEVNADFVVVGANAADRVARGKTPVGSVSLQICLLYQRNFIVANWIDVIPRVYEELIRSAATPTRRKRDVKVMDNVGGLAPVNEGRA